MIEVPLAPVPPPTLNGTHPPINTPPPPVRAAAELADHPLINNRRTKKGHAKGRRFLISIPTCDNTPLDETSLRQLIDKVAETDEMLAHFLGWYYPHVLLPHNLLPNQIQAEELDKKRAEFERIVSNNSNSHLLIALNECAIIETRDSFTQEQASLNELADVARLNVGKRFSDVGLFFNEKDPTGKSLLLPEAPSEEASYAARGLPYVPADDEISISSRVSWALTCAFGMFFGVSIFLVLGALDAKTMLHHWTTLICAAAGIVVAIPMKLATKALAHFATERGYLKGAASAWMLAAVVAAVNCLILMVIEVLVESRGLMAGATQVAAVHQAFGQHITQPGYTFANCAIAALFSYPFLVFASIEGHISGRKYTVQTQIEKGKQEDLKALAVARMNLPEQTKLAISALDVYNHIESKKTDLNNRINAAVEPFETRIKQLQENIGEENPELTEEALWRIEDAHDRKKSVTGIWYELLSQATGFRVVPGLGFDSTVQPVAEQEHQPMPHSIPMRTPSQPKPRSLWQRIVAVFKP